MSSPAKKAGLSDNSIGAIAYFTPVLAIFFLAIRRYNKRPYVRFHAWQSLVFNVFVIAFVYGLTIALPFAPFVRPRMAMGIVCAAALAAFFLWLWCVIGALNGKRVKLPIIGDWAHVQAYE